MTTRILLADDHKIIREGLRDLIEGEPGMEVVGEAGDGQEAVDRALELSPDVIVMDVTMPRMSGIDATKEILSQKPETKIVALSIHSERHFIASMLAAGASAYLPKDSAFKQLVHAINASAAGNVYLSPDIAQDVMHDYLKSLTKSPILTDRQREVLKLVSEGMSARDIAEKLDLSVKTVEMHRKNIMDKLGLHSTAELTKYAIREGIGSLS